MSAPIRPLPPRVRTILEAIGRDFGMQPGRILAHDSHADVVAARREAVYRLRCELGLSYSQIGRFLGIHHTAVMYHLRGKKPPVPFDFAQPDESGSWNI